MNEPHPYSYAVFLEDQRKKFQYINNLNNILSNCNFGKQYTIDDFHFRAQYITDRHDENCLSVTLSKKMWQPIHDATLYHYTSRLARDSIESSKKFRLYSIEKRLNNDELVDFFKKFSFSHPLKVSSNGMPNYKSQIAPRLFYASFTSLGKFPDEERKFIEDFGKVRLKVNVKTRTGCLRKITYGSSVSKWGDMHKQICDLTQATFDKKFHWGDAAQACALHLPSKWRDEDETRLIVDSSWGYGVKNDGKHKYIEINEDENNPFSIKIIEAVTL